MDTKALRQKILDLAIRGKLVPQDPSDEPASVLLERIREQKKQMVKEGKLKAKDIKNDTIIFVGEDNLHYEKFADGTAKCIEDEIPFELPEGWEWTRFLAITINRDSERKPISASQRTDVEKIYDYYGASGKIDKIDKYIFDEKLLLIGEDGANLVTRSKPIAFFAEGKYWVNNHAHCIDSPDKSILQFICFFINAISLEKYVTGSAQPKMTQDNMNSILVALPPYKEQQLISQQLDIVWASIDKIEFEKENVLKLVDNAKSKILDLATRGKLVPQDPNDEPASVLLERIRVEKEELIKQGKIKHDKKESVIFKGDDNSYYEKIGSEVRCIDEEIPFDIPDTWIWMRLSSICSLNSGKSIKVRQLTEDGIYPVYGGNGINGTYSDYNVEPETIIIGRVGFYCGSIYKTSSKSWITDNALITTIKNPNIYNLDFLANLLIYLNLGKTSVSTAQPVVSGKGILPLLVPVPPMKEQLRIISQINKFSSLIDCIEESLS